MKNGSIRHIEKDVIQTYILFRSDDYENER